ncbi:magnesium transporter CorA family protein [Clostridium sp. B9]|uniref:magnesium transporter CorA family protein n=1 Tax=Clostridium sp. B9 TaxID=3423224 RepID=UPI003D2F3F20
MVIFNIKDNFNIVESWRPGKFPAWILIEEDEIILLKDMFSYECIKECIDYKQDQRIDYFKDYIFILINIIDQQGRQIISKELDIFLGETFIITVYKSNMPLLYELIEDIKEGKNSHLFKEDKSPSIILYYILDRIIKNNYNIISDLEAEGDKIELEILKDPDSKQLNSLLFIRREAYKLRKLIKPIRYIGDALVIDENGVIGKENIIYFKNINNKIEKLITALDTLSQELAIVREAYESELANKTNELMKVFTIITAVFLPLELITAVFSMSFECMPFKSCPYGFYGLVSALILMAIVLLLLFKIRKIL